MSVVLAIVRTVPFEVFFGVPDSYWNPYEYGHTYTHTYIHIYLHICIHIYIYTGVSIVVYLCVYYFPKQEDSTPTHGNGFSGSGIRQGLIAKGTR